MTAELLIDAANAGATTAAVMVALFFSTQEARRRKREERDAAMMQARLLSILQDRVDTANGYRIIGRVVNDSASRIMRIQVRDASLRRSSGASWRLDSAPKDTMVVRNLAGGDSATFGVQFYQDNKILRLEKADSMTVEVEYMDATGQLWRRRGDEQPVRIT